MYGLGLIEIVVASKGLVFLIHNRKSCYRRAVRSQRREREKGFSCFIGNDFTAVDGTAAADAEYKVCLLNGRISDKHICIFIGSIAAVPKDIRYGKDSFFQGI